MKISAENEYRSRVTPKLSQVVAQKYLYGIPNYTQLTKTLSKFTLKRFKGLAPGIRSTKLF
jgi:hypothetical protein